MKAISLTMDAEFTMNAAYRMQDLGFKMQGTGSMMHEKMMQHSDIQSNAVGRFSIAP
jgi:hypothetical protein